ncbi:MAG: trehalose-phosphatase [Rhizobacter sp.]|nr:trehalose-phosphatase [Rhizobacter sp.]
MQEPEFPHPGCALFFDFDGTLVEIAHSPDAVRLNPAVPELLARLQAALGGAVAVVSGRPMSEIDHHLRPLTLCAAGVHGAERRGKDGHLRRIAVPGLQDAAAFIDALCQRHPALRMEIKPGAIALHYRQAPELEDDCLSTMIQALQRADGMTLLHGKQVVEMKPRRAGKGVAVRAFLDEMPFLRRQPWFFGDDVTDESAFEAVLALRGVAVKVGEGETLATHRLADPAALHRWMARAVERLTHPA